MNNASIEKSTITLFSLRLFFYLSVLMLLAVHPAIVISFDRIGIIQWFVIIPLMSIFAFLPYPGISLKNRIIISGISLFILSLIAGGFSITAFSPFFAGCISFILTFLLFKCSAENGVRWGKLSLLEPFFLIWVCLRLLALSRSGEEIAGQSIALTQFILVWSAVVFLLHGVTVYFCLFPNSKKGAGKESALFAISAAAVLVLVLAVLPPDFIRNSIVENLNRTPAPQRIGEDSDRGMPRDGRRQGRRTTPRSGSGERRPELLGMSEYDWQSGAGGRNRQERDGNGGSGENRQYMVKIVASQTEPLYMGDAFKGQLDSVEGFLPNKDDPLNEIPRQRLFATWRNPENNFDAGRTQMEIFSLSTLQEKYLPYYPAFVDPTIINEGAGPLRYIHQVVSEIHANNTLSLLYTPSRSLNMREEIMLASYLDIPLFAEDILLFNDWVNNALLQWEEKRKEFFNYNDSEAESEMPEPVNEHLEKILAILTGFSEYQYNLSYNEEVSIERVKEFLFKVKEGDCVEFSNSTALLGRLAGIPSRVVTGYLVSEELQTEAHLRGLASLRRQIPVLQQFPFDNLFMVTNYHGHSWTQFYIPDYGWLDFETTSFAIPPPPTGDINNMDVVIPLIDENKVFTNLKKFPWRAVLRALGIIAVSVICGTYVFRYGREAVLLAKSRAVGREGARALYLLLLAKLAADGKPIKPASKTASEYSELFTNSLSQRHQDAENAEIFIVQQEHFKKFAVLYSELRWREFEDKNELNRKYELLKQEYRSIINISKRKGIGWWFIRIISLRGLAYL